MPLVREVGTSFSGLESASFPSEVLSPAVGDGWELRLPPGLKPHESEIQALLGKVFAGRPMSRDNLELAQQMTLNWCTSKCRKLGITLEESLRFASGEPD